MPKWLQRAANTKVGRFTAHLLRRYYMHDVAQQGAALTYYLLFMIFPFLIFLSSLLGLLQLDISSIMVTLGPLLPSGALELIKTYFDYVSATSNTTMMWFGLVFSIYFPMRAAACLMQAVRRAYHLPRPKNEFFYSLKVLLYTVFLLLTIVLTLLLTIVGQRALAFFGRFVALPWLFVELWNLLRFAVLAVVVFAAIGLLYAAAQDKPQPARNILPGVVCSLSVWMLLSYIYSYYVEHFGNYSVIYGALGAVIVLLIWLYLTAELLIMGAEVNETLITMRGEDAREKMNKARPQH